MLIDDNRDDQLSQLGEWFVNEIKAINDSRFSLRDVLCIYFKHCREIGFSTGELIDFLGVSSPSFLELAGFNESEEIAAMEMVGSLTDEEIDRAPSR